MMTNTNVVLRNAEASDIRFIVDSWSRTLVDNYFKYQGGNRYPRGRKEVLATEAFVITSLLQSPDYKVTVACDIEDNQHIFGFICGERNFCPQFSHITGGIIDFIYVKLVFRRFGIGKQLLGSRNGRVYVTNSSTNWQYLLNSEDVNIQFVPEAHYRRLNL